MNAEPFLEKIVQRIISGFDPQKIMLFGSYAYGQPTPDSDLDLLIVMQTEEKPHKRAAPIRKLLKDIGIPKDIVVKTPEEFERFGNIVGNIVYPAAQRGKILYEKR